MPTTTCGYPPRSLTEGTGPAACPVLSLTRRGEVVIDDPDERVWCPPAACCGCGAGLAGEPVTAQRRHQVTDIEPAPAPKVTEYVAQAKECPCCGTVTEGELPAHVRARASFGPETCAQAANLTCGHHIPVYRATLLLCQLAGVAVSTGWMAGIRGKAAALVGGQRVHGPGPGAAEDGAGGARGRDPGPRGGRDPVRAPGLHPLPDAACTPVTGPRTRSTPAACCPATPASSSATATPATGTSPSACTPGAGFTCSGT